MTKTMNLDRILEFKGKPVYASDGAKIGSVEEVFVDQETNQPEWVGIGTGIFGTKRVLVPVQGATFQGEEVRVEYPKDKVKEAPDFDDTKVDQDTERQLYEYYGLSYSHRPSTTGLPEGGSPKGKSDGGQTMTRSEEELRVGKRDVERGGMRLRKFVEKEPASADVELRKETAHVERQPINKPVSGEAQFGEKEISTTTREEEPVVQKQAIAKEQLSLKKDEETRKERVDDTVRKERIAEERGSGPGHDDDV